MADISAAQVKELREKTGCGMMDCKKALVETNGDMEKAITILREKGLATAVKKASRIAAEGLIAIYNKDGVASLVEVNCETDFVAKNDKFKEFAEHLAEMVALDTPADVDALNNMKYNDTMTVEDMRKELVMVIRENMTVRRFAVKKGNVFTYSHTGGKIGVVAEFTADDTSSEEFQTMAKFVCMQIAAMNPAYMCKEEVPAAEIQAEKDVLIAQIKNDPKNANKPDAIIEKMIGGKLGKFYAANCLLEQEYFMDESMTVAKFIEETGKKLGQNVKLNSYVRFEKGEGIQKREENFADEVAKAMNV